jgi:hypothetical protein
MAERKTLLPRPRSGNPFAAAGSILGELERAYDQNGNSENLELEFQVKTKYEDVTGQKKFESSLIWCIHQWRRVTHEKPLARVPLDVNTRLFD